MTLIIEVMESHKKLLSELGQARKPWQNPEYCINLRRQIKALQHGINKLKNRKEY